MVLSLHSECFDRSAAGQQEEVMLSSDTISRQCDFVCMFLALLPVLSLQVTQPMNQDV